MKPYLLSLGAGILVGIVYALLQVRSPAPPVIALVGLFGILIGEQAVPVAKQVMSGVPFHIASRQPEGLIRVLGEHLRPKTDLATKPEDEKKS